MNVNNNNNVLKCKIKFKLLDFYIVMHSLIGTPSDNSNYCSVSLRDIAFTRIFNEGNNNIIIRPVRACKRYVLVT